MEAIQCNASLLLKSYRLLLATIHPSKGGELECKTLSRTQVNSPSQIYRDLSFFHAVISNTERMVKVMERTAVELARQFRVRVQVVYDVIYTLQTKNGLTFRKIGNRFNFTPEELDMVEAYLNKRGHQKVM